MAAAVGEAGVLIPPRDVPAAVAAVRRVLEDGGERARLVAGGNAAVQRHTMEHEAAELAAFLRPG